MPPAGRSISPIFTRLSPNLTAFLRVSLPIQTTATWTFFSLIPLLPVMVLPVASISASKRYCVRSTRRELPPTPVLPRGYSSTATASTLDAEEYVECRGADLRRFGMHKQLRSECNYL